MVGSFKCKCREGYIEKDQNSCIGGWWVVGGGGGEGGAVKGGTMHYNKIQSNTTRYKVMQYDTK